MNRKIVSFLLAILMLAAPLTSCAHTDDPADTAAGTETDTAAGETETRLPRYD